jgi:hypothetical protein
MNNKIICAVITFILISILLVSCSKASSSTDKTVSNISDVTVSETDMLFAKDNLPDLDFEGTDIVISIEDYGKYTAPDFYVEAQNGDVVNDSVFQRNQAVSERLNVNLV